MSLKPISRETGTASLVEWAKLALEDLQAPVLRVTQVRHDERFGTLLEQIVLSLAHFPGLTHGDVIPGIAELAQRFGLTIGKATERIDFVQAPRDVARQLGIAAGTSVVKLDRITETTDGAPVEWRVAYAWKASNSSAPAP
jgi:GntR family transcriptional regulator